MSYSVFGAAAADDDNDYHGGGSGDDDESGDQKFPPLSLPATGLWQ